MSRATFFLRACAAIGLACLLVAGYLTRGLLGARAAALLAAKDSAEQQAREAATQVDAELRRLASVADALAQDLGAGTVTEADVGQRVERIMRAEPALEAAGIAYAPADSDAGPQLYAPSWRRDGEDVVAFERQDLDDYTDDAWYVAADGGGSGWADPEWQANGPVTATYAVSFRGSPATERSTAGVVYVSLRPTALSAAVDTLNVGQTGYGLIVSRQGDFIVHPSDRVIRQRVSVLEIADLEGDEATRAAAERAIEGERGFIERLNLLTGQSSWFFYEPIPATGWSLAVVRIRDEIESRGPAYRRAVIWTTLSTVIGLALLAVWLAVGWFTRRSQARALWGLVVFVSVTVIAGTSFIRYVAYTQLDDAQREGVIVVDQSGLGAFLRAQEAAIEDPGGTPPHRIPTGVFLQSVKFISANEVSVNGVLWQKVPERLRGTIGEGFVLPHATNAIRFPATPSPPGPARWRSSGASLKAPGSWCPWRRFRSRARSWNARPRLG